ncbi:hypothetical protein BDR22DRAFT_47672 [Usnea florida]
MAETCYGHTGPDAQSLLGYGPCNPQAGSTSLCCEIGQTCLTNGLCVTPDLVYYNGGCTDSTYKAAICPTFCTSGDANWVVKCQGAAVKDGDFCCSINGSTTTCCNTASNGLGLVAAISSAQAVSATSVGPSTVPASTDKGATTSSSGTIESEDPLHNAQNEACMLMLGSCIPFRSLHPTQRIRRSARALQARSCNFSPAVHSRALSLVVLFIFPAEKHRPRPS